MLTIRDMKAEDYASMLPMVEEFYHSEAVEHPVERSVLERSLSAAIDPAEPMLRGLLLLEGEAVAGYAYVTRYYSAEVGGHCLMFEEMYFKPPFRGKGYGSQVFQYVMAEYPDCVRIRLEVTQANRNAIRLYERLGFRFLEYGQMILDREGKEQTI